MKNKRVFLVVLDSLGIGHMPDASSYGDEGANTLASVMKAQVPLNNLHQLGLFNIAQVAEDTHTIPHPLPIASYGRLEERSKGKDTTTGHWEMMGIISEHPLPVFPNGFPTSFLAELEEKIGRGILCNLPYSGTDVIRDYGEEHIRSGKMIVYTSADSVFQIAAHEEVVPLQELYQICETARALLQGDLGVGRVIARPFTTNGDGEFVRTSNRHDYSLLPPEKTILEELVEQGRTVVGIGKIKDIFAGKGITHSIKTANNTEGISATLNGMDQPFHGLVFTNLVDFDMAYGHRNDIQGYAEAMKELDDAIPLMLEKLTEDDLLIFTGDHGCDPGFPGTDHTRETVPILCYQKGVGAKDLGCIEGFDIIGNLVKRHLSQQKINYAQLIEQAIQAREKSYCPYSKFAVGACLLSENGELFTGCNIESVSFSPTCCAERTAFFKAISEGITSFSAIAIVGAPKELSPPFPSYTSPCGVCRQVMSEFCSPDFQIILARTPYDYQCYTLQELLPLRFS